jgi:hypothetical protein
MSGVVPNDREERASGESDGESDEPPLADIG